MQNNPRLQSPPSSLASAWGQLGCPLSCLLGRARGAAQPNSQPQCTGRLRSPVKHAHFRFALLGIESFEGIQEVFIEGSSPASRE